MEGENNLRTKKKVNRKQRKIPNIKQGSKGGNKKKNERTKKR